MRIGRVGSLVAICAVGATPGPVVPEVGPSSLAQLGWLAGCLELRSGDRVVEEQRMGVRGGSMLGMARTTTSAGLLEYELTVIHEKDGRILFEARPSGQPVAVFTATAAGPDSVVFGAPDHDYPQIVGYRRAGADSVVAWIDGRAGGKQRKVEFPYARVPCSGSRASSTR